MEFKINKYFLFLLLLTIFCSLNCSSYNFPVPSAVKGKMDLRRWDFEKIGNAALNGEWEFYWNKTLSPEEITKPGKAAPNYFILPSQWNGIKNTELKNLPPFGTATYRLRVKLPPYNLKETRILTLKLQDIHSCYKLWINGRLFLEKGKFSEEPGLTEPAIGREVVSFEADSLDLDIVINTANFFDLNEAGVDEEIFLGTEQNIMLASHEKNFFYLAGFGILLIMSLYHFLLFIIRKNEKQYLYFSVICLLLSMQTICEGDKYIFYLWPGLSPSLYLKIWLASLSVVAVLFRFYFIFFPGEFDKKIVNLITAVFIIQVLYLAVFPIESYMPFIYPTFYFTLAALLYLLAGLFMALLRKRKHSVLVFAGILLPLIAGVNDLLYGLAIIYTGYYCSVGFILLIFSQSYFLALRYTESFRKAENLSLELEESNRLLDRKVEERTAELKKTNDELHRVIAVKNRFFSIIAHDMKNLFQSMLGYSDLIIMRTEEKDQQEINEDALIIKGTTQKAYSLMENLLEWSLAETGNLSFIREELKLKEIVVENTGLLEAYSRAKNVCINTEVKDEIIINADRRMLNTVLRNLLSNAVKYSYSGSAVEVMAERINGSAVITVSDKGKGIEKEKLNSLFSLSAVQSTPGTNNEKGTGLGLILVHEFVQRHNGEISVSSKQGCGTSVKIILPLN